MKDSAPKLANLQLDGLTLGESHILGPISISIAPGETLAILGPSGIGKTSLLRIFAGLETRFHGRLNLSAQPTLVFQEPTLLPWRTALQNITIASKCTQRSALAWLDEVGLVDHAGLFPGQLSLGQQRRLSLARAYAAAPELLLMDEPFVSLDDSLADEMIQAFECLRKRHGTTTLFVTHAKTEAMRLADRVITLGGQPATIEKESVV